MGRVITIFAQIDAAPRLVTALELTLHLTKSEANTVGSHPRINATLNDIHNIVRGVVMTTASFKTRCERLGMATTEKKRTFNVTFKLIQKD